MFYAPWCGHSKSFSPTYDDIAATLQGETKIVVAKVDAVEHADLFYSENIEGLGFPTLKAYVKGGDALLFDGERQEDLILSWVRRLSIPQLSLEIEGGIDVFQRNYLTKKEPVAVLVTPSTEDSKLVRAFEYACKKIQRLKCAIAATDLTPLYDQAIDQPAVVMIRDFDDEVVLMTASPESLRRGNQLYDWMVLNSYPAFPSFNIDTAEMLFTNKRPGFNTHVLVVHDSSTSALEFMQSMRSGVVSDATFQGKCVFASMDNTSSDPFVQSTLTDIEYEVNSSPVVVVIKSRTDKISFYRLDSEGSSLTVHSWLTDLLAASDKITAFRTINIE